MSLKIKEVLKSIDEQRQKIAVKKALLTLMPKY